MEAPREGQASYVHVREIIAGFRKQGVRVALFQPQYARQATSPRLRIRLFHLMMLQIKMWVKWRRGSVLYIRSHYMAFPSAVIAHLLNISTVNEINGPYEDVFVTYKGLNKLRHILIFMQRWQYKKSTRVIAVTKELQAWANKEGNRQDCEFVSNGANIDIFKPAEQMKRDRPADVPDKYVVFFGGLTRWHGVPVMLEAIESDKWPSDVKLVVIGKGHESARMQKASEENDNIVYLGKRPYKEVALYVAHALASIVMISNPDNRSGTGVFPLKLFETLACGIPAIVSDLPGQADFIRDYNCGVVVPVDDSVELVKSINFICDNSHEANEMGKSGYDIVLKEHSWFKRSEQTLGIIRLMLGENKS